MRSHKIVDTVNNNPIIAAIATVDDAKAAIESPCEVIFLLSATLRNMNEIVDLVHSAGKLIFIHVDLMKGLACDLDGLTYLKKLINPDGIISTKGFAVKKAKEIGFVTVQRLFVLDSKSIDMGIKQLKDMKPDFVEVMPGALVKTIARISERTETPVIAGGLIDDEKEVVQLLKAGAVSVSTSAKPLWEL